MSGMSLDPMECLDKTRPQTILSSKRCCTAIRMQVAETQQLGLLTRNHIKKININKWQLGKTHNFLGLP